MTASPDRQKPSTWRAWQAQNGSKRWYWRAPLAIEWGLEWLVHWLRSMALFELLELAGRATVLVAVILWFMEAGDRAKERHYRAWDLINSARGSTSDGGRRDALQDLNRDGVSLNGAPLEQAYLAYVDLGGADLISANLQGAKLMEANLQGAALWDANLQDADLGEANLTGAVLQGANLQDADLGEANLQDADINDAHLTGTVLQGANLQDARNLTQAQLDAADGDDRTVLPEGLTRPAHWSTAASPTVQPDATGPAPPPAGVSAPDK